MTGHSRNTVRRYLRGGEIAERRKPLTLLPEEITSLRWRCRYTNFYQLRDTAQLDLAIPQKSPTVRHVRDTPYPVVS